MRLILTIFLAMIYFEVAGQKIEYLNDSLFINDFFIDALTPKSIIDKILNETGKTTKSKSKFRKNPTTGKNVKEKTVIYLNNGLYFRWYDYDSTKLSIAIRLHAYTNGKDEANYGIPGNLFQGKLFIAGNYLNDKRLVADLQKLENCKVTIEEVSLGASPGIRKIIGGDIVYKENIIRLSFDPSIEQLTTVLIHHNFKDR